VLNTIHLGNCLDVLKTFPDNSIDAIVTDPPYGLGNREPEIDEILAYLQGENLNTGGDFMGRDWSVPSVQVWKECYRVLKPGGHVLSFAGTRTLDLISMGLRAAGFESRDTIASQFGVQTLQWVQGSGFPKSRDSMKNDIVPEIEKQLREQGVEGEIRWQK
jgi:DNA modification methylase